MANEERQGLVIYVGNNVKPDIHALKEYFLQNEKVLQELIIFEQTNEEETNKSQRTEPYISLLGCTPIPYSAFIKDQEALKMLRTTLLEFQPTWWWEQDGKWFPFSNTDCVLLETKSASWETKKITLGRTPVVPPIVPTLNGQCSANLISMCQVNKKTKKKNRLM